MWLLELSGNGVVVGVWSVGKKSAFEVLLTLRHLKVSLNPSARCRQSVNLADSAFGVITKPQEELLENRIDMRLLPWGRKDSCPGALPACLYHKTLSAGLTLSGLIHTPREGRACCLAMLLTLSLKLPQPSVWGQVTPCPGPCNHSLLCHS